MSDKPSSVPARTKPAKPHPDYPLYAHGSGQWARKIMGKTCYFGARNDPDSTLSKYLSQKDDLLAGREVHNGGVLVVRELVNHFLLSKKRLVISGELKQCTWDDYHRLCAAVIRVLGQYFVRTWPTLPGKTRRPQHSCSELSPQECQQFPVEAAGLLPPGWARGGDAAILVGRGQDVLKAEGAISGR